MKKTRSSGQQKEQQAKEWLNRQGIKIIENNFHCKGGEIDLIGLDTTKREATLVFFEVKYRKNSAYGHPAEFVTLAKQRRIIKCAQVYLLKHTDFTHAPLRFDVITFEGHQNAPDWIQDAFGA